MSGGPFLRAAMPLAMILGGCASNEPPDALLPSVAPPTHVSAPNSAPVALPANIGRSVEGRPIEMYRFGPAIPPVLIIAAIHGNERNSAACAELLLQQLRDEPGLTRHVAVAIILVANPDGVAHRLRHNARHIDLNRNFPATNWTKGSQGLFHGGPTPQASRKQKASSP